MKLLDFINSHSNWIEELEKPPYSLTIKQDGIYYLIKYDMIASDFTLPEVLEARGSIFRFDGYIGKWICVCRALDKFANWQESYAATPKIDWSKGVDIQQKIDGSLCKLWYDMNEWHLSTSGTIDAKKADCGDSNYYDVFFRVLNTNINDFCENINPENCYWFELVSKDNPIVVQYKEEAIYYLGARNMRTMKEYSCKDKPFIAANIKFPNHYTYHSLAECVEAAHQMGDDEEGYVIVSNTMENNSFLRVKVKGDEYARLHRLRGNEPLTIKRVVEMFLEDSLDDYIAFFPQHHDFIKNIINVILNLRIDMILAFEECKHLLFDRKEYARAAFKYNSMVRSYLFTYADNKCNNAYDYIKDMRVRTLSDYVSTQLNMEDEV